MQNIQNRINPQRHNGCQKMGEKKKRRWEKGERKTAELVWISLWGDENISQLRIVAQQC